VSFAEHVLKDVGLRPTAFSNPPTVRRPPRRSCAVTAWNRSGDKKTLAFSMEHLSLAGGASVQPSAHVMKHLRRIVVARYEPHGAFELLKGLPPAPARLWDQEAGHRWPLFRQCGDET
jgi:hypothetical protein